jgi:hypothetical protein
LLFGGKEIWGVGDGGDDVCVGRWWEIVAPLYVDMGTTMTMITERNRHEKRKQRKKSLHRLRQRRYHPPARGGKISLGSDDSFWNLQSGLEYLLWLEKIMHSATEILLWNKPG